MLGCIDGSSIFDVQFSPTATDGSAICQSPSLCYLGWAIVVPLLLQRRRRLPRHWSRDTGPCDPRNPPPPAAARLGCAPRPPGIAIGVSRNKKAESVASVHRGSHSPEAVRGSVQSGGIGGEGCEVAVSPAPCRPCEFLPKILCLLAGFTYSHTLAGCDIQHSFFRVLCKS
jgi:hypothetical protein